MKKTLETTIAEVRYRRLFETARDGILILDPLSQKITDANPAMTKLLGYSHKELVSKTIYDIGVAKDSPFGKELFKKSEKTTQVFYEDVHLVNKSGHEKEVEVLANIYEESGRTALQCSVRDMTDRKRAEQELFQSKQRLEALMNALPVGVTFSSDTTCEYITGNPTLVRQLEMHEGDNISASTHDTNAAGRKLIHYINGRLITGDEMPMQRSIAENRTVGPVEIEVKLPSGKRWFMEAIGAPIHDAEGNVVASVAVNVDLTERKRAEEATELERLIQQEKVKIEFIADATHELRTPLAIIKGNVDLALRGAPDQSPMVTEAFHAINNEVMHLANLLSDLTLLTIKGTDFQRKLASHKVKMPELITRIAKRHQGFAKKKHIKIQTKNIPPVSILGDELYLEKLFSNIVANAVSYGKENGSVTIAGSKNAKELHITITDNGVGISKKDLPHIFDRFYRAESSRSKDTGGSGLGLAIVKWIAEAHGGHVRASSVEHKGSIFTVTLPLDNKATT